jgi:Tfp pilus assembly protein PilF
VIDETTIVAMYMNNRAAESMASGDLDTAYWWAREAIAHDPKFASAYNTIGAIYYRHGNLAQAEAALRYALAREARNTPIMSNLVVVLTALGRTSEANELGRLLAQIEPDPPFSFYNRGVAAMRTGDFKLAKAMFGKEVDRAPYYHEFHFWLAAACVALGEHDLARKEMALAIENSPSRRDRELYASKLAKFDAQRSP